MRDLGRRGFLRACGAAAGVAAGLPLVGEGAARAAMAGAGGHAAAGGDPDVLFQEGQFAAADAGYARMLEEDPGDAHAWAQRGYIALLSNRFSDTERFLGRAIKLVPGDVASLSRLADCYVRQDDFGRAVPLLRAAGDRIGATQYGAVTGTPYQISGSSATLPFRTLNPLPSVDAAVNGVAAPFTLDTGATFTFSAEMAKAAGVRPAATVLVNHGSGPVQSYIGVVDSLRLGQIEIRNIPVLWDDVSFTAGPAGVIGTTIFYHFQATMDYAGRALTLRPRGTGRPSGPATAPLWLAPDHFIFSWGRVGKAGPGPVLIDTGGVGLGVVLTKGQAAAAGVVPDYGKPEQDLGATVYPCTADVALGATVRRAMPGVVMPPAPDQFGFGYLGTLSQEFFKPLSVTFDFAAMNVILR
jgi:tetratricopeptide (TPR) repeat protein